MGITKEILRIEPIIITMILLTLMSSMKIK